MERYVWIVRWLHKERNKVLFTKVEAMDVTTAKLEFVCWADKVRIPYRIYDITRVNA